MKAGRELDARIATEVMGWIMHPSWDCLAPPGFPSEEEMWTPWEVWDDGDDWGMSRKPIKGKVMPGIVMDGSGKPKLPDYSADIAAAWQVIEKLLKHPHIEHFELNWLGVDKGWFCYITAPTKASTVPLVICLAALEAIAELEGGER